MIGSITHGVFFFNFIPLKDSPCIRPGRIDMVDMKIISASRIISTVSAPVIWEIQNLCASKKPPIDSKKSCNNFEDIVKKSKIN